MAEYLEKSGKVLREQEDKILVARNQDEEVENQIQEIQAREETIFLEMNSHAAKVDERRREIQNAYNQAHGIVPKTIIKASGRFWRSPRPRRRTPSGPTRSAS